MSANDYYGGGGGGHPQQNQYGGQGYGQQGYNQQQVCDMPLTPSPCAGVKRHGRAWLTLPDL